MHLKGLTPAGISAPRLRFKRRPVTGSSQGGSVLTAGTLKGGVRLEHNANTGRDKDGPRREEKKHFTGSHRVETPTHDHPAPWPALL